MCSASIRERVSDLSEVLLHVAVQINIHVRHDGAACPSPPARLWSLSCNTRQTHYHHHPRLPGHTQPHLYILV